MGAMCGRPRREREPSGPTPPVPDDSAGKRKERHNIDMEPKPGPSHKVQDKELFVITIDLGTTGSGVAYCYRDGHGDTVFQNDLLKDWPGAGEQRGALGKTPTELIFDSRGNVLEWGAACLNVQKYNDDVLARNGWIRSRYFKCKILTTDSQQGDLASLSRLPPGITPVKAWGLYLKELHKSAIEQIAAKRGVSILERCKAAGKLQYVITCPVQWRQDGLLILEQLREEAVLAGLVKDPYDDRLTFLPESEASALYCYRDLGATLQPGMVFTVVDAGGGTVDMTVYQAISLKPTLQLKELKAPVGLFRGSVYIDEQFQVKIQDYLQANYPGQWTQRHVEEALSNFRKSVKPVFSMNNKDSIFLQAGAFNEFVNGALVLEWHDIEDVFLYCVEPIGAEVERVAFRDLVKSSTSIFLVGGLGGSPYLRSYLEKTVFRGRHHDIDLVQPDNLQNGGSQAVVLGALHFALEAPVTARIAPATYGVKVYRVWQDEYDFQYPQARKSINIQGQTVLAGLFSPIVVKGTEITTDEPTISSYDLFVRDTDRAEHCLTLYQCQSDTLPAFVDDRDVQPLCEIVASFLPKPVSGAAGRSAVRGVRRIQFDVQLFFGRSTITALIVENGEVRGNAQIKARS